MASKVRVLLVEDHPVEREALDVLLTDAGFWVRCAADGEEALRMVRDGFRPGAVVADVHLPRMSGRALLELLREQAGLEQTYMLLITAQPTTSLTDGALPLLRKPIIGGELVRTIRAGLEQLAG